MLQRRSLGSESLHGVDPSRAIGRNERRCERDRPFAVACNSEYHSARQTDGKRLHRSLKDHDADGTTNATIA